MKFIKKLLRNQMVSLAISVLLIAGAGAAIYYFSQQDWQPGTVLENENEEIQFEPQEENSSENQLPEESFNTDRILDEETYSILVPAGWAQASTEDSRFLALMVKPMGEFDPQSMEDIEYNAYYAVNNASLVQESLEKYVNLLKQNLIVEDSTITVLDQYSGRVGDREAIYLELQSFSGGQDYKTLLVFVEDGEWVWALSFNTPSDSWEDDEEIFHEIVESLTIK
jgi:hypothetical protein